MSDYTTAEYPPDCDGNPPCKKCHACFAGYVAAKMAGELDDPRPQRSEVEEAGKWRVTRFHFPIALQQGKPVAMIELAELDAMLAAYRTQERERAVKLPNRVLVAPDTYLPVTECNLNGKLGCVDGVEIRIEADQPEAGKHSILLHELMHVASEKLKDSGVCKRQPSEAFIENMAGVLFLMLAGSGLWNGVSPKDAMSFAAAIREK